MKHPLGEKYVASILSYKEASHHGGAWLAAYNQWRSQSSIDRGSVDTMIYPAVTIRSEWTCGWSLTSKQQLGLD